MIYLSLAKNEFYEFYYNSQGFSLLMEAFKVLPGTVQSCASILKDGNCLAIAPGGVYEAQFGNSSYELLWKNRVGFAKVAVEAKVVRRCIRLL